MTLQERIAAAIAAFNTRNLGCFVLPQEVCRYDYNISEGSGPVANTTCIVGAMLTAEERDLLVKEGCNHSRASEITWMFPDLFGHSGMLSVLQRCHDSDLRKELATWLNTFAKEHGVEQRAMYYEDATPAELADNEPPLQED